MSNTLPTTLQDILATGKMAEEFVVAWSNNPQPPIPNDINVLKKIVQGGLPMMQAKYASTRPANITETEHHINLHNGYTS